MRIGITGEKGFIGRNLAIEISKQGHEFVSLDNSDYANETMIYTESNEVCVYSNTIDEWVDLFDNLELDVIVHNAAVVGTDGVEYSSNGAYPFLSGGYTWFNSTNWSNAGMIRWQANSTHMLSMYGAPQTTNWTSGSMELHGQGILMLR